LNQVKDLPSFRALTDVELWYELPSSSRPLVPLDSDVKRTFSVDVTGYVGIQPFLLIDRT
jgi:hypothetical protein